MIREYYSDSLIEKEQKIDYTYLADFKPALDRVLKRLMYGESKHGARITFTKNDKEKYRQKLIRHAIQYTADEPEYSLEAIVVNALILMIMEEE